MQHRLHPLSGGSFLNFLGRAIAYGVDTRYLPRFLLNLFVSSFGGVERQINKIRYRKAIDDVRFDAAPVFVIGHWRSGTTYLHHLLSQDKRFSYVTSYQAAVPELFLADSPLTRRIVSWNLPQKRPMDNVQLSLRQPEEEEMLMGNISPYSYIHTFSFPKASRQIFHQSILFEGLSAAELARWGHDYVRTIKIACLGENAYRPLLKSPGNTGRIRFLLKLFPNAKFIHIYRDPRVVFASMFYTYGKLMDAWKFQDISSEEVQEHVLYGYEMLMKRYFEDRDLIPAENLIEVRYEEFEREQFDTLRHIYQKLDIPEFEQWAPDFKDYIAQASGYRKNRHELNPKQVEAVRTRWGFAMERLGYSFDKDFYKV